MFLICCAGDAADEKPDENPSEYGEDPTVGWGDTEAEAGAMD